MNREACGDRFCYLPEQQEFNALSMVVNHYYKNIFFQHVPSLSLSYADLMNESNLYHQGHIVCN